MTLHLPLGQAWAGNTLNTAIYRAHGLFCAGEFQFSAFHVDAGCLRLVRRGLRDGRLQAFDLRDRYALHDAHHTVSLGIDRAGHLHLAHGHHASRLRYRRALRPWAIDAWSGEIAMTGLHEARVTYPGFLLPDLAHGHGLAFLYRDGRWNRGSTRIKHYDEHTGRWSDLPTPVLSGDSEARPANAYWNHPAIGPDGRLCLSWLWRSGVDDPAQPLANRDMGCAVSSDQGRSWQALDGSPCTLPIAPGDPATLAWPLPPAAQAMNQCGMAVDSHGHPHIVFHARDTEGIAQVWHLRHDGDRWHCQPATRRARAFALAGLGTLRVPISRPDIVIDRADRAYVILRGDEAPHAGRLSAQRLLPPHYAADLRDRRALWPARLGSSEPVLDRVRWARDGILSLLVQHNAQPDHDGPAPQRVAPIQIVEHDLDRLWRETPPVDAGLRLRLPPRSPLRLRDGLSLLPRRAPAMRDTTTPKTPPESIRPLPVDTHAVAVDVVVCVHDALDAVRDCLGALALAWRAQDRLVIVDDASGPTCAAYLRAHAAARAGRTLLRHDGAAWGYCRSANQGIAQGRAPWVLLLNSDTVLPPGALDKMLRLGLQAADIGLVGPLSNAAQFQSIPEVQGNAGQTAVNALPPGADAARLDACCAAWAQGRARPVVPLVHGFCLLVRRALFDGLGSFDEAAFPEGYGEEHDLCLRAGAAGWRGAIATDAFVQHAKSASYSDAERRERLMRAGWHMLVARHGSQRLNAALHATASHPELDHLRQLARNWFNAQAAAASQPGPGLAG